jgi:hypothetical protein
MILNLSRSKYRYPGCHEVEVGRDEIAIRQRLTADVRLPRLGQSCPLYPQKLPRPSPTGASAKGQKRTSEKLLNYLVGAGEKGRANQSDQHPWLHHGCTLAADIKRCDLNVGFVPIANIGANLKVYLVRWRRQTAGERVHPLM